MGLRVGSATPSRGRRGRSRSTPVPGHRPGPRAATTLEEPGPPAARKPPRSRRLRRSSEPRIVPRSRAECARPERRRRPRGVPAGWAAARRRRMRTVPRQAGRSGLAKSRLCVAMSRMEHSRDPGERSAPDRLSRILARCPGGIGGCRKPSQAEVLRHGRLLVNGAFEKSTPEFPIHMVGGFSWMPPWPRTAPSAIRIVVRIVRGSVACRPTERMRVAFMEGRVSASFVVCVRERSMYGEACCGRSSDTVRRARDGRPRAGRQGIECAQLRYLSASMSSPTIASVSPRCAAVAT